MIVNPIDWDTALAVWTLRNIFDGRIIHVTLKALDSAPNMNDWYNDAVDYINVRTDDNE